MIWRSQVQITAAPLCRHAISLRKEFTDRSTQPSTLIGRKISTIFGWSQPRQHQKWGPHGSHVCLHGVSLGTGDACHPLCRAHRCCIWAPVWAAHAQQRLTHPNGPHMTPTGYVAHAQITSSPFCSFVYLEPSLTQFVIF